MITFKVGDLFRKEQGTRYKYNVDEKCELELDHPTKANIKFKLTLMKLEDGINAYIEDLSLTLQFKCERCNIDFDKKIAIKSAERVFYFDKQEEEDPMDVFYVDMKNSTLTLDEFLRQEIILHFPTIPVHSNSCKGLCPKCGINLNEKTCNCTKDDSDDPKQLAILKKLYNA
ncbi:DUF177 domain-containing protein [Patescibacteria group bacterium]